MTTGTLRPRGLHRRVNVRAQWLLGDGTAAFIVGLLVWRGPTEEVTAWVCLGPLVIILDWGD